MSSGSTPGSGEHWVVLLALRLLTPLPAASPHRSVRVHAIHGHHPGDHLHDAETRQRSQDAAGDLRRYVGVSNKRRGLHVFPNVCSGCCSVWPLWPPGAGGGGDRLRLRGRKSSSRLGLAGSVVKHVWRMLEEGAGILAHGDKAQVSTPDMARAGLPRCFHRIPSPRVQVATCFHGPQARDT